MKKIKRSFEEQKIKGKFVCELGKFEIQVGHPGKLFNGA